MSRLEWWATIVVPYVVALALVGGGLGVRALVLRRSGR